MKYLRDSLRAIIYKKGTFEPITVVKLKVMPVPSTNVHDGQTNGTVIKTRKGTHTQQMSTVMIIAALKNFLLGATGFAAAAA